MGTERLEFEHYLDRHCDARDKRGHALVTRNGKARPRKVTIGSGTMEVTLHILADRQRRDATHH